MINKNGDYKMKDLLYEVEQMIYYTDDIVRINTLKVVKKMIKNKLMYRNKSKIVKMIRI